MVISEGRISMSMPKDIFLQFPLGKDHVGVLITNSIMIESWEIGFLRRWPISYTTLLNGGELSTILEYYIYQSTQGGRDGCFRGINKKSYCSLKKKAKPTKREPKRTRQTTDEVIHLVT